MAVERYYWRREIMLAAASIEATSLLEGKERKMEPAEGEISNPICMRGGGGGRSGGYTSNERVSGRYECTSSNKDTTGLIAALPLPGYRRLALAISPFSLFLFFNSKNDSLLIESGSFLLLDKARPPPPPPLPLPLTSNLQIIESNSNNDNNNNTRRGY